MKKTVKRILLIAMFLVIIVALIVSNAMLNREVIPQGGKYTTASGKVLTAGEFFPMFTKTGDCYVYGNYEYCYNKYFTLASIPYESNSFLQNDGFALKDAWVKKNKETPDGWGVRVLNKQQEFYGVILEKINGKPITSLQETFNGCVSLITAPPIPNSVVNMNRTFASCYALTNPPNIPDSVKYMYGSFMDCHKLTVAPQIPYGVINMDYTFCNCTALKVAPEIPHSVLYMTETFRGCDALAAENRPKIPPSVIKADRTF